MKVECPPPPGGSLLIFCVPHTADFFCSLFDLIKPSKRLYAVKVRRHTPWSRGPLSWIPGIHSRRHSLRITLKSTTLVHMRSRYAWTRKSWQRSEWRLDFNSVKVRRHTPWSRGPLSWIPGAYCIKLLTGENSGYFLPEFFPVLKSMAESC